MTIALDMMDASSGAPVRVARIVCQDREWPRVTAFEDIGEMCGQILCTALDAGEFAVEQAETVAREFRSAMLWVQATYEDA